MLSEGKVKIHPIVLHNSFEIQYGHEKILELGLLNSYSIKTMFFRANMKLTNDKGNAFAKF